MIEYSEDEARIVRLTTFKAGKEKGLEEGKKQGALEELKIIKDILEDDEFANNLPMISTDNYLQRRIKELECEKE